MVRFLEFDQNFKTCKLICNLQDTPYKTFQQTTKSLRWYSWNFDVKLKRFRDITWVESNKLVFGVLRNVNLYRLRFISNGNTFLFDEFFEWSERHS